MGKGIMEVKNETLSIIVERSTEPWSILTESSVKNRLIFSHFQFDSIIFQLTGYFSLFALWSTKINLNHRSTIVSTTVVPKLKYKLS